MRYFKHILLISLSILLFQFGLYSQFESDSTWDLNNLDYDKLNEKLDKKVEFESSTGWFPYTSAWYYEIGLYSSLFSFDFEIADDVSSSSIIFNNLLSGDIDFENNINSDERSFYEQGRDNGEAFPSSDYYSFGINFNISTFLPFKINTKIGISMIDGVLYAIDESKQFLNYNGKKEKIKELNIFYLSDYSTSLALELEQPIYGAFIEQNDNIVASYYYLKVGYNLDIPFSNNVVQYLQIADKKENINYGNRTDRYYLYDDEMKELMFNRNYLNLALGLNTGFVGVATIGFELEAKFMQTSLFKDADWKQINFGLNIFINYSSGF